MNTKLKGYVLGAVAAASYGMNPLFALPLYKEGMDPDSVLFFRYLLAIPLLGIMIKARGRDFRLKRKEIVPLIVMGLLVALSSLTLFLSYNYMDAGIASTLLFVYPVLVALIMALVFKEKLTMQTGLCIVLALVGIALLYRSGDGTTLSLTGTVLVLVSALAYAIYIVGVNQTALKSVATLKVTFYVLLFGLSLFLVRLDFGRDVCLPDRWYSWGNLLALAVLYDQRHTVHRFHAYRDTRRTGTRDRRFLRGDGIWRGADAEDSVRDSDDNSGRDLHRSRRQHHRLSGAFPQTLPEAVPAEACRLRTGPLP